MQLLPYPWERSHLLSLRTSEPLETSDAPFKASVVAVVGGTMVGLGRRALMSTAPLKPGFVMTAIGSAYIGSAAFFATVVCCNRALSASDVVGPILADQEKVSVRKQNLYGPTKLRAQDACVVAGAAAGLIYSFASTRIPRHRSTLPKFGPRRAAGGVALGSCVVGAILQFISIPSFRLLEVKKNPEPDVQTAQSYFELQRGDRPDPPFSPDMPAQDKMWQVISNSDFYLPSGHSGDESWMCRPLPCKEINGEWKCDSQRDYFWRVQDHMKKLSEARATCAKEAIFVWHEIADRERKYFNAASSGKYDAKERGKARFVLELLHSTHKNLWDDISNLDWFITRNEKFLRQLQSGGTWMPEQKSGSVDPKSHVPAGILEEVLRANKFYESTVLHFETAEVPNEHKEMVAEVLMSFREMHLCSGEFLAELEQRNRNSDDSSDSRDGSFRTIILEHREDQNQSDDNGNESRGE